jgi:predicted TPR repeat methyltransferase
MDEAGTQDGDWLLQGSADTDDVKRYYDEWAAAYDRDLADWAYTAPDVASRLLIRHGVDLARVLDAGCGTGLVGTALRRGGYTGTLHGVDLSPESLRRAEATGAYDRTAVADLQRGLDDEDAAYDALTCVGVMTYVPDVERCWREFARVVRPDGVVVVTQRDDLWESRRCADVVDALAADRVWTPVEVTDVQPYLPANDEEVGRIGVRYVVARVT